VTVSATAAVAAAPDRATVQFAVVETARSALADEVDAGVPDGAVETTSFGVAPVYEDGPRDEPSEPTAYRATHALAVERPVDDAGRAVDAGADEVDGVAFARSDERRAELRSEAVDAARADADAAGLSVDRVVTVAVEDEGPQPFDARAGAAGGTSFDPAPASVRASVRVTHAAS